MPTRKLLSSFCHQSAQAIINGFVFFRKLSEEFVLYKKHDSLMLVSDSLGLMMNIKKNGYIPKSGLTLADYLRSNVRMTGLKVLDVGTGEVGFLAHCVFAGGAKEVVGCDAELASIQHARTCSNRSDCMNWHVSDVYNGLNESKKFDLIVSNPPQMPMFSRGSYHDYGFEGSQDGRAIILRILKGAPKILVPGGRIFMLMFDFLGIEKSFNDKPSLYQISKEFGMSCRVVARYKKNVRIGGETEKNLNWISQIYPGYKFSSKSGGKSFNVCIVEFSF